MKKLALASFAALIVLSGCNTFKGFGQDVSKAGEGVSKSAEKVQEKI
ncbi:entericidin A/B family lipoprotein [Psychrobacter sp. FDAARGOS_221]|nr:entericidin A/B family lipoprotein [Psychrobacter sp. FDAARGOS_221]PNK59445.1 entericidin, EcnA/B family [Psychrobacter sp. FDAARGOS_221]PNK61732.1 entericidin, EcnA/B family [Psychrobacter sp. FDAARGOS_221]